MPDTTTIGSKAPPAGQGNPHWKSGPAHPRTPKLSGVAPVSAPVIDPPPPAPVAAGTTAQPASAPAPVAVPPVQTAAQVPGTQVPAPEQAPVQNQQPVQTPAPPQAAAEAAPGAPRVIQIDDPNTVIEHNGVRKTLATIRWEENLRSGVDRKYSELDRREKELEASLRIIEEDPEVREYNTLVKKGYPLDVAKQMAFKSLAPAPVQQQPVSQKQEEDFETPPAGKTDGDPEYEFWKAKNIAKVIGKELAPIKEALDAAEKRSTEQTQRINEANDIYNYNARLVDTELPKYLPDFTGLDEETSNEVKYRIFYAAQAEGIDLTPEGLKKLGTKLTTDKMRIIAMGAFSDGWVPQPRSAAPPAAPAPKAPDPAAELAKTLASGNALVPPSPPSPLIPPVGPSGTPAANTPQGNLNPNMKKGWKERVNEGRRVMH